ncbi:hypothetical protein AN958_09066, partial [Leucoagaricus sp. SymC.cos]
TSQSYLKIVDIPYFWPSTTDSMDSDYMKGIMAKLHMAPSFTLANTPCVMHNSAWLDSATVWFDIIDFQLSASAKHLINSSFQFSLASCPVRVAQSHARVPVCQCCWCWGHSTCFCCLQAPCCPWCSGPHSEANHRLLTGCCRGNPLANPPVPATMEGAPCPHTAHCVNCGGDHSVSDQKCPYWWHRFDQDWLAQRANRDWQGWMAN